MAASRSGLRPLISSRSFFGSPGIFLLPRLVRPGPRWRPPKAPVVIPIPGASRPESITDSAQAADLTLTPAELAQLDQS